MKLLVGLLFVVSACRSTAPDPSPQRPIAAAPALQLVETWPAETTLDDPAIPDAATVWLDMLSNAKTSVDIEQFYAINSTASPVLERLLAALEAAGKRGVRVRVIVDKKFYGRMRETPDRMQAMQGVEVRHIDVGALSGGVQHAKFFVVDGVQAFVGSQNFDWRSLMHIQELGLRLRLPAAVQALQAVFETDWALAGGSTVAAARRPIPTAGRPVATTYGGAAATVTVLLDPRPWLTDEATWELPALLGAIGAAKTRVRVQLLSYKTHNYDKTTFRQLDDALRAAAGRGVAIELLVADWGKRKSSIGTLQDLQRVAGVTVKMATIPVHSSGFIPFSRVIHSKFMTVDGRVGWVGTSNWAGDYFTKSRNVGVLVESSVFAGDLDRLFDRVWTSAYTEVVDPEATYQAPRRK